MPGRLSIVSVPYRGATFLNSSGRIRKWYTCQGFRPLSGSYISQSSAPQWIRRSWVFPSPIGELHFSITVPLPGQNRIWVSVPYRGATFLNRCDDVEGSRCEWVSVPYRGATFLNCCRDTEKDVQPEFPSPIGELHFSITVEGCFDIVLLVSVPYRGATFLNRGIKWVKKV